MSAMGLKQDLPHYGVFIPPAHIAGVGRDVYTGEAIADALIASYRWVARLLRSAIRRGAARPLGG
jgi:hypothetical protein